MGVETSHDIAFLIAKWIETKEEDDYYAIKYGCRMIDALINIKVQEALFGMTNELEEALSNAKITEYKPPKPLKESMGEELRKIISDRIMKILDSIADPLYWDEVLTEIQIQEIVLPAIEGMKSTAAYIMDIDYE